MRCAMLTPDAQCILADTTQTSTEKHLDSSRSATSAAQSFADGGTVFGHRPAIHRQRAVPDSRFGRRLLVCAGQDSAPDRPRCSRFRSLATASFCSLLLIAQALDFCLGPASHRGAGIQLGEHLPGLDGLRLLLKTLECFCLGGQETLFVLRSLHLDMFE